MRSGQNFESEKSTKRLHKDVQNFVSKAKIAQTNSDANVVSMSLDYVLFNRLQKSPVQQTDKQSNKMDEQKIELLFKFYYCKQF
jgi:hypothetical protein